MCLGKFYFFPLFANVAPVLMLTINKYSACCVVLLTDKENKKLFRFTVKFAQGMACITHSSWCCVVLGSDVTV